MKEQLNEMKSLIERMEKPRTGWGQVLNESKEIAADSLMNFFSKVQIREGEFAKLGYIQLYTVTQYPDANLYDTMSKIGKDYGIGGDDDDNLDMVAEATTYTDRAKQRYTNFMDKSMNPEWDKPAGRRNSKGTPFKNQIYKYIIKLTNYKLNWQGQVGYAKSQEKNRLAYNDIVANTDPAYYDEFKIQHKTIDANGNEIWHHLPRRNGPSHKYIGKEADFGIATDTEWKANGPEEWIPVNANNNQQIKGYFNDLESLKANENNLKLVNGDVYAVGGPGPFDPNTHQLYMWKSEGEYVPRTTKYRTDVNDPESTVEIPNFSIRNMLARDDNQKAIFYGVNEDGTIDPIPDSLGRLLYKQSKKSERDLQAIVVQNDPRKLAQFQILYDFRNSESMRQKIFKLTNIAYLCASGTDIVTKRKDSYFWVNREPLFLIEKNINKETVQFVPTINADELEVILKREASKEADGIAAFEE